MAVEVEKLLVSLEASLKQYEKEMARANKITVREMRAVERQLEASASKVESQFSKIGSSVKAGLAGAAVAIAGAIGSMFKNLISDAANIGDLADKLGVTTDKLQELQYGAVQANLEFDDLSKGLLKFSKSLGEARNGQGDLLKLFEANGYSKAEVQAMSYSKALDTVADLINGAKSEQDGFLIVTQAFGKGGDGFLEFLSGGSQGLKDFAKDATEAGSKINEDLIRKSQELDDKWAAVMLSMKGATADFVATTLKEFQAISGLVSNNPMLKQGTSIQDKPGFDLGPGAGSFFVPNPYYKRPEVTGRADGSVAEPYKPPIAVKPTNIPDPQVEAEAARKKAEADRVAKRLADDAKRAAEQKAKAIQDVVSALQFENEQMRRSELDQEINNRLRDAGVSATSKQGKAIAALVTENYNFVQSQKDVIAAQEQAIATAQEASDNVAAHQKALEDVIGEFANMGLDAFDAIIVRGEKASDVLAGMGMRIADMVAQAALLGQGPLANLFGLASPTGGLGGFLGSLFGGGISAGIYHSGGTAGAPKSSRSVHPSVFSGAHRYHKGGIAGIKPGEIPAILQPGELIIPKGGKGGGMRLTQHITISGTGDAQLMANVKNAIAVSNRELIAKLPGLNVQRQLRVE